MHNLKSHGTEAKTSSIRNYQICLLNWPIKYMNEFIEIVWNEHFSVNNSAADYVIIWTKITLLLLSKTRHKHGSKMPISNITDVFAY